LDTKLLNCYARAAIIISPQFLQMRARLREALPSLERTWKLMRVGVLHFGQTNITLET
jgi:hypothetical protein